MEKTVIILVANCRMQASCQKEVILEVPSMKGSKTPQSVSLVKSIWTCCVESVCEYSRLVFDLLTNKCQICVVVSDATKCMAINTWRDEDQELSRLQEGFQKFGMPVLVTPGDVPPRDPLVEGIRYGVTCLAQLNAPQFARVQDPLSEKAVNGGRIILMTYSEKKLEVTKELFCDFVMKENKSIVQSTDKARLLISTCDFVLVNVQTSLNTIEVTDSSGVTPSVTVTCHLQNVLAKDLYGHLVELAKVHFSLSSTIISGIPMKEDQSGGNSINYDVELFHHSEAHRDIYRAGYGIHARPDKAGAKKNVTLRWSSPKQHNLSEVQFCSSAYCVTPANVISRPTVCLVNFVLSGRAVLLEQPRRHGNSKIISHMLLSHKGAMYLHCMPQGKSALEEPPSMTEGEGGRVTDYRIADFVEIMNTNRFVPYKVPRTKIPHPLPLEEVSSQLERQTRVWPIVFSDSILVNLQQEVEPLLSCSTRLSISDDDYEKCKQIIVDLQNRETSNEPLLPSATSQKTKGNKREEQYQQLWTELEELLESHKGNSDRHNKLLEIVKVVSMEAPSNSSRPPKQSKVIESEIIEMEHCGQNRYHRNNDESSKVKGELLHDKSSHVQAVLQKEPRETVLSMWKKRSSRESNRVVFAGRMNSSHKKADLYKHLM